MSRAVLLLSPMLVLALAALGHVAYRSGYKAGVSDRRAAVLVDAWLQRELGAAMECARHRSGECACRLVLEE